MKRFKWMSRALAAFGALTLATSLNANAQTSAIPDNAATYATYQGDVSEVGSRPLNSKSDIEQKLEALGGHNSGKLASGWLSYSALVAAQNRDFANSVRDIDAYYGRERLLAALEKNPGYFTRPDFAGSQQALNAALTAAKADESRMRRAAAFMEAQEASLQNQSWIKERIRDGKARADRLLSCPILDVPYLRKRVHSSPNRILARFCTMQAPRDLPGTVPAAYSPLHRERL